MKKIIFINPAYEGDGLFKSGANIIPLAVATLAGLTPEKYEMKIIDENVDKIDFNEKVDLIAINCLTTYAPRVYEISQQFMSRGVPTIVGGSHPSMLPKDILQRITTGQTVIHPITIPEGFRITEIADLLIQRGLIDKNKFMGLTGDKELLQTMEIPGDSLEGYLYPETYHFSKFTDERKIIQKMLETFKERAIKPEYIDRARKLNFTFHEIITLASLIEKETGVDEERNIISSVFHNRLRKKMLLQTDPTVIYAMRNFDGNIRKKDLSIDSPYNTYKNRGLPPGPIASPGIKSIHAALYPEKTKHLYFVSKKNGSHQFSNNLIDHNRAVKKYQLKKVRRYR